MKDIDRCKFQTDVPAPRGRDGPDPPITTVAPSRRWATLTEAIVGIIAGWSVKRPLVGGWVDVELSGRLASVGAAGGEEATRRERSMSYEPNR